MDKLKVSVLGATGLVGQRFIAILSAHPWFEVVHVTASPQSTGRKYKDAVVWLLDSDIPKDIAELRLGSVDPDSIPKVDIVFSALPSSIANDVEVGLARRGFTVISNASPLRLDSDVPLLNPEVNYEHINALKIQKVRRGWRGAILKDPNCTTSILTLSLSPIVKEFGVREVVMVSMQAISGAGLKGLPAYAITDNLIPYIEREEFKVLNESRKIFGRLSSEGIVSSDLNIAATTTRVPVIDGHTEVVYVKMKRRADIDLIKHAMKSYKSLPQDLRLPTAPERPIIVRDEVDRPQPRLDRYAGGGMSVVVGRLESFMDGEWFRYVVLGHNTIRGAAGNAVLIAELYLKYYLGVV